ncbi:MAG: alpha/beta fold hydrolase [Burkholderiales bacterium]|nr:alpha/beta fold hydrolase [Burkholderiales bacterium]
MQGASRDVILVHGLWVGRLVMTPLGAMLARAGLHVHLFGYRGRRASLAAHASALAAFARRRAPRGAHYVGHSLGGLVVLEALTQAADLALGCAALLGTPARGCLSGRRLAQKDWGRWFLGASEPQWREGRAARWTRSEPLGVVAGTRALGLGRMFGPLPGANDGVVRVEETTVEGMRERLVLPVGHSEMLVSPRVAHAVRDFLAHGRFSADAR